ncbi:MAG TPA: divalent metal cation transporter [Candidatus Limnocylindria bacterium]|jgi:Mn2+/Fe2+ NRAMP family transporter|nr:divalent metal cation transporter [Candidatus Limnocylindria bacterium]
MRKTGPRSRPGNLHEPRRRAGARAEHFGAGIVSGASDNDPTTVATLAVVGSTTAYELGWLTLLVIPMLAVVQAIAAQVGAVSKRGLEDCVRTQYGRGWAFVALAALLAVNILTLAADLEGGGAALGLLTPLPYRWWIIPLGALTVAALIFSNYSAIERVLRVIPLLFLTYIGAAILAHPDWGAVLHASFIPHFDFRPETVSGALALLGTTLTAYAYVWETIEVSEEKPPLRRLGLVQVDAALGIVVAGLTFWFILISTGATLGVHHRRVDTAEQAAQALAPIAGHYAQLVFAIGLLGSALVAIPVIAGTCAYVAAEMFGWRRSLDESFAHARRFYLTLGGCVAVAVAIAFAGVKPITLLFYSGIAGGIATPFTMALMLLVARNRKVMHQRRISVPLACAGWCVAAIVSAAALIYLAQTLKGGAG